MSGDIVERLRSKPGPVTCWGCGEWGCKNEAGQTVPVLCACDNDDCDCHLQFDNNCSCDCHGWYVIVRDAADEIERLRAEIARLSNFLHPAGMLINREVHGESLTTKHMGHYNHCNCLADATQCCDHTCECHQLKENNYA